MEGTKDVKREWKLIKGTPLNKGDKSLAVKSGVSFEYWTKEEENYLLGDVMVCSFNLVDHYRSLTGTKL